MKRLSMVLALVLVLGAGSVWAQDVPKVEVFGGGSILNVRQGGGEFTAKGWTASVNGNVHDVVGIVGEIGGNYKSGSKVHNFLGGIQLTRRAEKVSGFAQFKGGLVNFKPRTGSGDSDFQLSLGGGLDWNAAPNVAIRLFQIDWQPVNEGGGSGWTKNIFRGSIGIVWKSAAR
jgi:hypothetical protein